MFARARLKYHNLKQFFLRLKFMVELSRKDIAIVREELRNTVERQHDWWLEIHREQLAILKRLSSIEMEMIIMRGGCLDNNFEGKQDM